MDYRDFGRRIREMRRTLRMTQEELAEQVGISASFLGHIERGTRVASLETLIGLCNALCVTPQYLLSASLNTSVNQLPDGLTSNQCAKLREFLHMAEITVRDWDKD